MSDDEILDKIVAAKLITNGKGKADYITIPDAIRLWKKAQEEEKQ